MKLYIFVGLLTMSTCAQAMVAYRGDCGGVQKVAKKIMQVITVGAKYKHYKGKEYQVLDIGTCSRSLKQVVWYQALYDCPEFGRHASWSRDYDEFAGQVVIDGKEQLRFKLVENKKTQPHDFSE